MEAIIWSQEEIERDKKNKKIFRLMKEMDYMNANHEQRLRF